MKPSPQEESQRLEALSAYEVPGTVSGTGAGSLQDPAMLEITALAAEICNTPMAGISLLMPDGLYVMARIGPGSTRLPRGRMPCEASVQQNDVYEVPDARYHPDFRPDGIMVAGRAFRFYAGSPLITPAGTRIGCLYVQDSVPHTLTEKQKKALMTLSRQVIRTFELQARMRHMDRDGHVRRRVESALTMERNFVSTVLDTVGALVAVFDTAGRIVRFNRACEQVSGYEFSTQVGRYLWEKLIPTDDIPEAISSFDRLRAGRFPASFENHWQNRDGSQRRIAWSATALVDDQGQPTFIIATGIDVTDQRVAEDTLRESEARYRQLVEGSLGMICTHDLEGFILSLNQHAAESLGYSSDELLGRNLQDLVVGKPEHTLIPYLRKLRESGEADGRMQLRQRDGDVRVLAFRNKLIDVPGREVYVLGFGVDISEQVRAEEKLRALIHQSNSILESVGDGIYGVDLDGRVTVINPAAAQMLGYRPTELLGRNFHELILHTRADGSPYPESESPIMRSINHQDTVRLSTEVFWRKDGTSFPVDYVARPQIDVTEKGHSSDAVGVVVAFTDTTERRALDRMKDEFISTVSHELRTPLTSMRAALGLITGGALASRPEKMKQMLEIAIGNTDRLIKLVNDILDIERIGSGNAELHSMYCAADSLLERAAGLQQAAAMKACVHFAMQSKGVQVWADPDRILQALANLISNAIKFSYPGGEIRLSARVIDDHEAQFDIEDEGRGIPEDKLEGIFERFQQVDASDSRAMGGTGLGLAICRSIIAQHGGRIWASSPPGKGATFHFTLPVQPSGHLR